MKNMEDLTEVKNLLDLSDDLTLSVLDSLLKHIRQFYPDKRAANFYEQNADLNSHIPMAAANPILLTRAYQGEDHFCYVSFFLGPKIGHELSFRVYAKTKEARSEYVNLLGNIAKASLFLGKQFNQTRYEILPIANWFENGLSALLLMRDPIFGAIDLSIGTVEYIHAFGITPNDVDTLKGDDGKIDEKKAEVFVENIKSINPLMITSDE